MIELFYPAPETLISEAPRVKVARRGKRFSLPTCNVHVHVDVYTPDKLQSGRLWDVSQHGACLLLRSPLSPNQVVHLKIHAPSGDQVIEAKANVKWQDSVMGSYYTGLSFINPLDLAVTFLASLIRNSSMIGYCPQYAA